MTDTQLEVLADGSCFPKVRAGETIACTLGGADGRSLFVLTCDGEVADIPSLAKNARVEVCRVAVAGSGSP